MRHASQVVHWEAKQRRSGKGSSVVASMKHDCGRSRYAHLDLQQILPDCESAFVDVFLSNAESSQVCHFDGTSLTRQELECVQAGTHITLCLLTQACQRLQAAIERFRLF